MVNCPSLRFAWCCCVPSWDTSIAGNILSLRFSQFYYLDKITNDLRIFSKNKLKQKEFKVAYCSAPTIADNENCTNCQFLLFDWTKSWPLSDCTVAKSQRAFRFHYSKRWVWAKMATRWEATNLTITNFNRLNKIQKH